MVSNFRSLTVLKLCACVLMFAMACDASAQSVVTFQGNPAHTGVTSLTTPLKVPMAPAWKLTFPADVSYPLIANGMVYVVYSNDSAYGSNLIALNETTGATVWGPIAIAGTYFSSYPAYDNGVLYVVNTDGLLRTYNATTGAAGWTLQLPGQYSFSSPPTATGGVVYITGAGSGGTLYAVGESSHTVMWSKPTVTGDDSSPAVGNGDVYVAYACVWVYSFLASNGTPLWHNSTGCSGGGGTTPVLANGKLYARDTGSSATAGYVFNAASGGVAVGHFDAMTIPAIDTTLGYFLQTGKTLRAISLNDLSTIPWSFTGDGYLTTAPLVVDNLVFIGSSQGQLYALDKATGLVAWQTKLHAMDAPEYGNMWPAFAAGDGMLVVPAQNMLYGFNADHLFADGFQGP